MKIDKPVNPNYCATVVRIKSIIPLENCDNVVATPIFGFQAIVGKEVKVGDIGIAFPAETQLSDEYCYNNNLYRHNNKNVDQSKKGYIEDNRRVKAVKFRGHASSCLFMPLESLSYTKVTSNMLSEGDEFDNLNGNEICKKYQVIRNVSNRGGVAQIRQFNRVDSIHMPEHFDSANYFKWSSNISDDQIVVVTQKVHGTSIRVGHTIVKRKLNIKEKVASFFGVKVLPTEHDYVYGSRKVVKDANNPYQNHFYLSDIWTTEGKKLIGLLPENYLVFGELVGWTANGEEIQKNYTYSVEHGKTELYIYRIAIVNNQGHLTELSWQQVKAFCVSTGLKYVPELWTGKKSDLKIEEFIDKRFFESGYKNCLYLGENVDLVDEGVCIRLDSPVTSIYKAKSPKFLEHETKMLDTGEADLESTQSISESIN